MIVAKSNLWYHYGTSDKVYHAEIHDNLDGTYTVVGHWGRRGKSMQKQEKGTFRSHWEATQAYHSLVASKTAKGYRITDRIPA